MTIALLMIIAIAAEPASAGDGVVDVDVAVVEGERDDHANAPGDGDVAEVGVDDGPVTVVRRKRSPRPGTTEVPIRRQSLAVGGASAAQLLQQVPGVYVSQHAGQGKAPQLFIRGFDAEHGQDIEVRVGGVPINEVSNVHGHGYADTTFIPVEVVRALRVREGAADPRQGDFAVAGTVDYVLGLSEPGVTARASVGSFGLARVFVGARPDAGSTGGIANVDGDDTFIAGEFVRGDGFGPSRAFSRTSVIGGVAVSPHDDVTLRAFAASSASQFQTAGVLRVEDIAIGDDDTFFSTYEAGQGGAAGRHLLAIEGRLLSGDATTRLSSSLQRRDLALRHNFTGALLFDAGDTVAQTSEATTLTFDVEHDLRLALLGAVHNLIVGTTLRGDLVSSTQDRLDRATGVSHTKEVDADLTLGHGAVYVDSVLRLQPWLQLRAGARAEAVTFGIVDRLNATSPERQAAGLFVGPRASLAVRVNDAVELTAAYGEGFRTPQALSLSRGEQPPVTLARTGEVGVVYASSSSSSAAWSSPSSSPSLAGASLSARATAFGTFVEADRIFDHATASSLFIGPTQRLGVSGFVDVTTGGVGATASATAVSAMFVDGSGAVPFAPPLTTRLDVYVERSLAQFVAVDLGVDVVGRVELGASFISARPLPFADIADPVALVDGAVSVRVGVATLALECLNVTDARVADGAFTFASRFDDDDSGVPARHLTAAPPRLAQLTLALQLP